MLSSYIILGVEHCHNESGGEVWRERWKLLLLALGKAVGGLNNVSKLMWWLLPLSFDNSACM